MATLTIEKHSLSFNRYSEDKVNILNFLTVFLVVSLQKQLHVVLKISQEVIRATSHRMSFIVIMLNVLTAPYKNITPQL